MFDTARFEGFPNWFVCDGVESIREINCRCPHLDSPLMSFLLNHSVSRKMICCLVWASESSLIFSMFLVESWMQSTVRNRREQFVQHKQWAYRTVVTNIFHVPFSCVTLLFSFSSKLQAWIRFVLRFRWRSVSSFLSSPRHKLWCLLLESRRCLVIYLCLVSWSHHAILHSSGILIISSVSMMCTSMLLSFSSSSCSLSS